MSTIEEINQKNVIEIKLLSAYVEVDTSNKPTFFETCDAFFDQFDNTNLINEIIMRYPNFSPYNDIKLQKDTFIEILLNERYLKYILKKYDIDIKGLFKVLCKTYAQIFKGAYLRKIRDIIIERYEL